MKKISIAMTTILMALLMCLSTLFGCNLITTNYERDMKQIIATVQIDASAPKEVIYKKDLIASYINHNSTSDGHNHDHDSEEELIEEIVDELINDAVLVQYAMQYFATELGSAVTAENKWSIETYLDEEELLDAQLYTHQDMNELLDTYIDKEEKVGDTYSETVRVVPTGATNDTEMSKAEKLEYVNGGVIDVSNRRQAFAKVVNMLEENDLLGDDYVNGKLETTEYYKEVLKSYQQSELLANLEEAVEKKARETVSYSDVVNEYARLYEDRKAYTKTKFEEDLDSLSASKPILYGRQGYGTVYHILLKATDDMTADLADWKKENEKENGAYLNADYSAKRAELFKDITAKDQRESWIYAGYDFDGEKFTGDYTLYENESLPFYGSVTHLNAEDKDEADYVAKYRVDSVDEFTLKEVLTKVNDYLYKGTADIPEELGVIDSVTYKATEINDDFYKRLRELMFTFSGDDGDSALNTYKGYVIKPQPDADEKDEWKSEFAEEGRALLTVEDNKTFKVVATDYGYHIMFVGENFNPLSYNFPTLESFLNYQYGKNETSWEAEFKNMMANWEDYEDTDNYMYVLISNLSSTEVNKSYQVVKQEVLTKYVTNGNVVTKNQEAYKDLI